MKPNPNKQIVNMSAGPEGSADMTKREVVDAQVYEEPDEAVVQDVNAEIAKDIGKLLKSKAVKIEKVVGRAAMLDPGYQYKGIDYRAGGLLDVRWVRNNEAGLSRARAHHWVYPETISPRLKNQTHNELVLMVRLQEQSDNQAKFLEQEAQKYERQDFDKNPNVSTNGFSEFQVTRPTKRAEG